MQRYLSYTSLLLFLFVCFTSCKISQNGLIYREVLHAEKKLGIKIHKSDYIPLYLEAAKWIGTPYLPGGQSIRGTDCSGFTTTLYKRVYRIPLSRQSDRIYRDDCRRISRKSDLKSGDLVFFRCGKGRKIDHVGIYLKDNKFIHAAVRGGVQVNSLNEAYYRKTYYRSGRVKRSLLTQKNR